MKDTVIRVIVALAIAVALAVILILLARDVQGESPATCISTTPDEDLHLKRMMERAFDRAFEAQIASLYKVYIGNVPSVEQQRLYTKAGMENAIAAWRTAMDAVNAWEGCR